VGFDNSAAMARVAQYLLSLNHRDIGVISGDIQESDRARLRLEGTRQAMRDAGVPLPEDRVFISNYSMEASRAACRELMRRAPQTTAIMCHNDVQAFGAILELQKLGLSVPHDVSITGFDDLEWARHISPALTTVRVPWGRMAEIAAEMLVKQLKGEGGQHATILDWDLVVRDSTAPPKQRR
jgi:LacI family transcriptional regulator